MAIELVDIAHKAGADAVKFQLYQAKEQASELAEAAAYQQKNAGADNQLEMAKSYELDWKYHHDILAHCKKVGISYMASCFDPDAVDFLIELGGDAIKVGSGEITNFPLLKHMAKTDRPILLSTGMSDLKDVSDAILHIKENGSSKILLFQCTSNYPCAPEAANLKAMQTLAREFNLPVGFSDHTEGSTASVVSVALGARMIEKHFTIDKKLPGPDHIMSLSPKELEEFIKEIRTAELMLGSGEKVAHESEINTRDVARRSIVAAAEIKEATKITKKHLTLKRPGTGIDPRRMDEVLGKVANKDIRKDLPLSWEMLK
jgi:sialic acid synthase SpsE